MIALRFPNCRDMGTRHFDTHDAAVAYGESSGFEFAVSGTSESVSRGHIGNSPTHEFYVRAGEVYRAPTDSPLDIHGYRMGGRWESSVSHFTRFLVLFTGQAGLVVADASQLDGTVERTQLQTSLEFAT